jgi:hypothetical protein
MNCQSCQKVSDLYQNGNISDDIRNQVEDHLESCKECADYYKIESLTLKIIKQEKELSSNPFLITRIMAGIERSELQGFKSIQVFDKLIRPVILTGSLTLALFIGVVIGNIHRPAYKYTLPIEFALVDDIALESIDILLSE